MTFGEKLARFRKENNYTQEQLAELLGVSRQSVSKWESDVAYPETERLIRIAHLFSCSLDELLKEEISAVGGRAEECASTSPAAENAFSPNGFHFLLRERKSEKTVLGMPLYHVGRNAHGFFAVGLRAHGVISLGLFSRGVVSLGLLSFGVLSFGVLALGVIALGTLALGLLSIGTVALGLLALGAIAIGVVSFGALSVGCFSAGAMAIGKYIAVGDRAEAMIAIGMSAAQGSVFQYVGEFSSADLPRIAELLDASTPTWLSWARELFRLLLV